MPIGNFRLTSGDIGWRGQGLSRPECVLAERDGTLWCSDDRGGVTRIDPQGRQSVIGTIAGLPNGFAIERGGSVLIANIEDGKVYRLHRDGRHEIVLDKFDGKELGSVNFVYRDGVASASSRLLALTAENGESTCSISVNMSACRRRSAPPCSITASANRHA